MKLKDLIKDTSIDTIIKYLDKHYSFLKKDKTNFIKLYNRLKEKSNTILEKDMDYKLYIREIFDDFTNEKYIKVSGINLNDLNTLKDNTSLTVDNLETLTTWSLMMINYEQWLNIEIIKYKDFSFSNDEIMAFCLFEMSYLGFDNKKELI